jgi:hypothetical protein
MKLKNILKIALVAPLLVACNESDDLGGSDNIATFSATIDGVSTRVNNDAWDSGDAIGIRIKTSDSAAEGNYKYITADGTGKFAPAADANGSVSGNRIIFNDKSKMNFVAYYPYFSENDGMSASSDVIWDNGIIRIYSAPVADYMFAQGSGSSTKPDVALKFSHKMSQLAFNLTAGDGVDNLDGITLSLSGIIKMGTFSTIDGSVTLTGNSGSDVNITSPTYTDTDKKSVQESIILLPQPLATTTLTVTLGSKSYAATINLPKDANGNQGLLSGNSVSYSITVNAGSLSISDGSIVAWATPANSGSIDPAAITADNAQLYDLALKDGTFVRVWDDDADKLSANITALGDKINDVVGIVYWLSTGSEDNAVTPLTDDALLASDHSDCTHGYILALKDMALKEDGSATTIKWQDESYNTESVSDAIDGMDAKFKPQSENSILISYDYTQRSGETEKLNKALGYNNTKLLRAFNYYCADYNQKVRPIEYLDLFAAENEAPKGSSGWYLPSPKELVLMVLEDNSEIKFYDYRKSITPQFSNIQRILEALGENASNMGKWYWSSSESKFTKEDGGEAVSNYYAWFVGFVDSYYGGVSDSGKNVGCYVRAVCAF